MGIEAIRHIIILYDNDLGRGWGLVQPMFSAVRVQAAQS